MKRRDVGRIRGSGVEVGTQRVVLDGLGVFWRIERTQLVNNGRGWIRVTTPVKSEMAQHVVGLPRGELRGCRGERRIVDTLTSIRIRMAAPRTRSEAGSGQSSSGWEP